MHTLTSPDQLQNDLKTRSNTELRGRYPRTYNAWRNMLQRAGSKGAIIAPELTLFRDFLSNLGACEEPGYTLDRIDNSNPQYAVGLVRWASSEVQNRNRSNNVHLTLDGQTKTISEWASETKQNPSTLYARHAKGWTAHEVIHGKTDSTDSWAATPWPPETRIQWETLYQRRVIEKPNEPIGRLGFLVEFLDKWRDENHPRYPVHKARHEAAQAEIFRLFRQSCRPDRREVRERFAKRPGAENQAAEFQLFDLVHNSLKVD